MIECGFASHDSLQKFNFFSFQLFHFPANFECEQELFETRELPISVSISTTRAQKSVLSVISKTCFPTHKKSKLMKKKPSQEICSLWVNYFNQILKLC